MIYTTINTVSYFSPLKKIVMVKISYKGGEVGQPDEDGGDVLFDQYHANWAPPVPFKARFSFH